MTAILQGNTWAGLLRESPALLSTITVPEQVNGDQPASSASVGSNQQIEGQLSKLTGVVGSIRERGRIEICNSQLVMPEQDFIVTRSPDGDVIENVPDGGWPKVRIELFRTREQGSLLVNVLLRPSDDTVEAEVLYTRVWYTIVKAGQCRLHLSHGTFPMDFPIEAENPEGVHDILNRAKLYRKLAFLERVFKVNFQLPLYIPAEEIRKVEMVFRGITEGEFPTRGCDITFENVLPSELDLHEPPFSEAGPFSRVVGEREYLFGHWLELGRVSVFLRNAELANPRILKQMREDTNKPVNLRFIVPDHQIIHRFSSYASMRKMRRAARLNQFLHELSLKESAELVRTTTDLLVTNVGAESAVQIASDWIMLNRLPDRLSAQTPQIDDASGHWRVPIHVVYPGGEQSRVGEIMVHVKTGEVLDATPVDDLLEEARNLSENLVHAR